MCGEIEAECVDIAKADVRGGRKLSSPPITTCVDYAENQSTANMGGLTSLHECVNVCSPTLDQIDNTLSDSQLMLASKPTGHASRSIYCDPLFDDSDFSDFDSDGLAFLTTSKNISEEVVNRSQLAHPLYYTTATNTIHSGYKPNEKLCDTFVSSGDKSMQSSSASRLLPDVVMSAEESITERSSCSWTASHVASPAVWQDDLPVLPGRGK